MKWSKQNIEAFLRQLNKSGFVSANCLPWYRRCFWMFLDRFPSGAYGLSQENLLSEFTLFLSKKRLLDFQLRQARHCVLLFLRSLDKTEKKPLEIRVAVSELPVMDKDILLDELVKVMKFEHKSPKTIKSYRFWVRRFLLWPPVKPQKTFGNGLIRRFLTYLAVEPDVSPSTQNQAFHALLYFYRHVLRQEVVDAAGTVRAKKRKTVPSVMSPGEVEKLYENKLSQAGRLVPIETNRRYADLVERFLIFYEGLPYFKSVRLSKQSLNSGSNKGNFLFRSRPGIKLSYRQSVDIFKYVMIDLGFENYGYPPTLCVIRLLQIPCIQALIWRWQARCMATSLQQ